MQFFTRVRMLIPTPAPTLDSGRLKITTPAPTPIALKNQKTPTLDSGSDSTALVLSQVLDMVYIRLNFILMERKR